MSEFPTVGIPTKNVYNIDHRSIFFLYVKISSYFCFSEGLKKTKFSWCDVSAIFSTNFLVILQLGVRNKMKEMPALPPRLSLDDGVFQMTV